MCNSVRAVIQEGIAHATKTKNAHDEKSSALYTLSIQQEYRRRLLRRDLQTGLDKLERHELGSVALHYSLYSL